MPRSTATAFFDRQLRGLGRRFLAQGGGLVLPGLGPETAGPGEPHAETGQERARARPQTARGRRSAISSGKVDETVLPTVSSNMGMRPASSFMRSRSCSSSLKVAWCIRNNSMSVSLSCAAVSTCCTSRGMMSIVRLRIPGPSMYSRLGQRRRVRGLRACSIGRAPPVRTISVSAAAPSVPKAKAPSEGVSAASISVAAAPSPKIVRKDRSSGAMYFE